MADDRHSVAETASLLNDPHEIALREAENGIRQFDLALEMIRSFVKDKDRPFRLRSSLILQLHAAALDGIHPLAGTWRNTKVSIGKSKHVPPEAAFVSEEIEHLCDYVNDNWSKPADHLGAYVLWKLNWIHPFADGNGRTARAVAYVVMSVKLDSLLPGAPTIPEQIAANKAPYYDGLEAADERLKDGAVDVSALEDRLLGRGPVGLVHTHSGRIKYKKPLCQGSLRVHIFQNFSEVGGGQISRRHFVADCYKNDL